MKFKTLIQAGLALCFSAKAFGAYKCTIYFDKETDEPSMAYYTTSSDFEASHLACKLRKWEYSNPTLETPAVNYRLEWMKTEDVIESEATDLFRIRVPWECSDYALCSTVRS